MNGHASITGDRPGDFATNGAERLAGDHQHASGPAILHRFRHNKSILTLATTDTYIFAGTQGGEILVFALGTFERIKVINGHNGAVLGLCLSKDRNLLFSSAGDRIVNILSTNSFEHVASIYCLYDVGDIFCVSYSSRLDTLYLGAQNTSIQWIELRGYDTRPAPDPNLHPSLRPDRFFDSPGPGGIRSPRPRSEDHRSTHARTGRNLEINKEHLQQFAHYGYVYCMLLARGPNLGTHDEEILISGGGDGIIKLWNLNDQENGRIEEFGTLDDGRDEGDSVLAICFDGTFVYSGRSGGELNVWDLETRQLIRAIRVHEDDILAVSIGHGLIFSACVDGNAKDEKFNQQYECLGTWKAHQGQILASAATEFRDRYLYMTGGNDDTVAVWDVSECLSISPKDTKASHEELFDCLRQFISFKTVSSDPRYKGECRRGASFLRSVFKRFGATTEMLKTEDGCNPIVYARFRASRPSGRSSKRVLFYGHYDVIAAENRNDKWIIDPFAMEGIDGYLYGRGVSDNKGPIMAAIYAVSEIVAEKALETDIVFLIEGEEEHGSVGFNKTIEANKDKIGPVDWILLANSYWLDNEVPCLTYGLRGVIQATVEINSDEPDLHSGVDGSKLLDEPLKDLVMLLSKLSGPQGVVEIPGFYEPTLPITKNEIRLYEDITRTLLARNPDLGTPETLAASLMERWREPTLTIHGFKTSGSEKSTIIPRQASAGISLRLVPNQESEVIAKSLTDFLESEFDALESKNHLTVVIDRQAEPWLGDYTNEIFQTLEKAIMEVWEGQPQSYQLKRPSSSHSKTTKPSITTSTPASSNTKAIRRRSASHKNLPATTSSTLASSSTAIEANYSPSQTHSPISPTSTPQSSQTITTTSTRRKSSTSRPTTASSKSKPTSPDTTATSSALPAPTQKPLYIREGGSIPAIRFLEKAFDAPAAHLPCGQASDNAHLDNERFRVKNLLMSREIFRRVFLAAGGGYGGDVGGG